MVTIMLALTLFGSTAWAEPACEPTSASQVAEYVAQADAGLKQGDAPAFQRALRMLNNAVPCLDHVIDTREWAQSLLIEAIVAYTFNADWSTPLAQALRLYPTIDRRVSADHVISTWIPPKAPPSTPVQLPEGTAVWVDGTPIVNALPPLTSRHVLQRRTTDGLASVLVEDGSLPEGWVIVLDPSDQGLADTQANPSSREKPPRIQAFVGLLLGWGWVNQGSSTPEWDVQGDNGPAIGLSTSGRLVWTGQLVSLWDISASLASVNAQEGAGGPLLDGSVGLGWGNRHVAVVGAFGWHSARWQTPEESKYTVLIQPRVAVEVRGGRSLRWDAALGVGYTPSIFSGTLRGGLTFLGEKPVAPRVGGYFHGGRAWVGAVDDTDTTQEGNALHSDEWALGLTLGVQFKG